MSDDRVPLFTLTTSRGFTSWLDLVGGSLAFTTYQGNKVFFLGRKADGTLSVSERTFPRSMGLTVSHNARTLYLATEVQLYRFDNLLPPNAAEGQINPIQVAQADAQLEPSAP